MSSSSLCHPGKKSNLLFYTLMPYHILQWISVFCTEMYAMPKEESNYWCRGRGNMDRREIKPGKKWSHITHSHTSWASAGGVNIYSMAHPRVGLKYSWSSLKVLQLQASRRHWARVLAAISLSSGNNASGMQIRQEQVLALTSHLKERWPQAFLVKESKQPGSPG